MRLRLATFRRRGLPLLVVALACGACAALKESSSNDAGASGASGDAQAADASPPSDAEAPDAAVVEGGPTPDRVAPPLDSVCPEWAEKTTPVAVGNACDARRRMPIDNGVLTRRLGVAVTSGGRVAAGYGRFNFDTASELRVTHFSAASPSLADKATVALGNGLSNLWGEAVAVAAGEGDEVHVVSNDFDEAPRGQVVYRRFAGGALGAPSVVTTNVPRGAPLAIAAGKAGELLVTSFQPAGGDAAQGGVGVGMYRPGAAERFGLPSPFSTTVDPRTTVYAGAASVAREPSGLFQAFYCEALSATFGQPTSISKVRSYSTAGGWAPGATAVHNRIPDGLSGLDPAFVSRDGVRYATFFHLPANGASAQLVSLVWTGEAEPVVSVIERDVKVPPLGGPPSFAQALAVDSFGQMHVVLHQERPSSIASSVTYLRQTRVDGLTQWIQEDVDDEVSDPGTPGRVALALDSRDRPHILYYTQKRLTLVYATRFDR
ncbi:MAG: hypothetical protein IPQ09_29145 [Myxococcales bacterium]|jgi:hypothetical protein|nr:hypothetical protein [Myxococcales bacterium]